MTTRPLLAVMLLWTGAACGDASGPGDPTAGTYVLESVDGCAPGPSAAECDPRPSYVVAGQVVLGDDGTVTRTMQYAVPGEPSSDPVVSRGTFVRWDATVTFALVQDGDENRYVWRPRAHLAEGRLTLRFPHPADGETVEVFARR